MAKKKIIKELVKETKLTYREREELKCLLFQGKTLKKTGETFNVTRERIRQEKENELNPYIRLLVDLEKTDIKTSKAQTYFK